MIVLSAEFVKSATAPKEWPLASVPEIAFCGRSNVGKSSCLNALTNRRRLARISRTPGRTRLINFFAVRVAEERRAGARGREQEVRLVDLPGYGYAAGPRGERERWKGMIESYLVARPTLGSLVVLVDGAIGAQESDRRMVEWARSLPKKLVVCATKLDKIARTRRAPRLVEIAAQLSVAREEVVAFSARDRFGIDELWSAVL